MRSYLVFRLYGPLAAWGGVAVGEERPTAHHPTRSALLGLLSAALGLRREATEELVELGRTLCFAVRVESAGVPLRDFHTAQVAAPRRGGVPTTREAQLRGGRHELETILSFRDYRCDALYRVAAWQEGESPRWDLPALAEALARPVFPLYLGRRSCPPGLPLSPRVLDAPSAAVALEAADLPLPFPLPVERMRGGSRAALGVYWEGSPEAAGFVPRESAARRDDPVPRLRRSYRTRSEQFTPDLSISAADEEGE